LPEEQASGTVACFNGPRGLDSLRKGGVLQFPPASLRKRRRFSGPSGASPGPAAFGRISRHPSGNGGVFHLPANPQDPSYQRFADARSLLGIPNFQNVVYNVPFLLVGLIGLARRVREPAG